MRSRRRWRIPIWLRSSACLKPMSPPLPAPATRTLFDPVNLGNLELRNRIVMAPMTRSRADQDGVPGPLHVEYYRQRASAGLIVTEGVQPSIHGQGYCRTPGIHSAQQLAAWRAVTDAVHAAGGRMVLQLMHVGRIASHFNKQAGAETVAPSALRARGQMYTDAAGMQDFDPPRALATAEIPAVIGEFAQATANALYAGFDGVELHGASGYLPMQFLSSGSNRRTDRYGGSAVNRARFVVETLEAMSAIAGAARVGFRICPGNPFNDIIDDDPAETYSVLLEALSPLQLAYVHLIDLKNDQVASLPLVRTAFSGALVLNEGQTFESATRHIQDGTAEAVSFARYYLANPDLVERFRHGAPLAAFDHDSLYTTGARGYIDYPPLASVAA
jgi:N-ethylmaleimide reductase